VFERPFKEMLDIVQQVKLKVSQRSICIDQSEFPVLSALLLLYILSDVGQYMAQELGLL
jgi:hypothetical protein